MIKSQLTTFLPFSHSILIKSHEITIFWDVSISAASLGSPTLRSVPAGRGSLSANVVCLGVGWFRVLKKQPGNHRVN